MKTATIKLTVRLAIITLIIVSSMSCNKEEKDELNYFKTESYTLNDNKVPAGWELYIESPEIILSEGKLIAKTIDSYGGLGRKGIVPPGTTSMTFEWDGSLQYTYWGMTTSIRIEYNDNQYITVLAQLAEVGNDVSNRVWITHRKSNEQNILLEKEIVPDYNDYHYKVEILPASISFKGVNITSGNIYFNETITIPSMINFSFDKVNAIKFWANATTDNDCWLDNISVAIIK